MRIVRGIVVALAVVLAGATTSLAIVLGAKPQCVHGGIEQLFKGCPAVARSRQDMVDLVR